MYLWFSDQELKQLLDNGQQTQKDAHFVGMAPISLYADAARQASAIGKVLL